MAVAAETVMRKAELRLLLLGIARSRVCSRRGHLLLSWPPLFIEIVLLLTFPKENMYYSLKWVMFNSSNEVGRTPRQRI